MPGSQVPKSKFLATMLQCWKSRKVQMWSERVEAVGISWEEGCGSVSEGAQHRYNVRLSLRAVIQDFCQGDKLQQRASQVPSEFKIL